MLRNLALVVFAAFAFTVVGCEEKKMAVGTDTSAAQAPPNVKAATGNNDKPGLKSN